MNLGIIKNLADRFLRGKSKEDIGRKGEELAARHLLSKGYTILERNFKIQGGEVDIIAEKDGEIIFVEVKTRSSEDFMPAIEAVDYHKRKRLRRAAEVYLLAKGYQAKPCRFDVIAIVLQGRKVVRFDHLKNVQI